MVQKINPNNGHKNYEQLPRGGILIPTSGGNIQFGIPPETIKDTMLHPGGVPRVFIVPQFMFDVTRRIALADIEFPVYYNFFINRGKARIICNEEQRKRLEAVMSEALFGPQELDIIDEFVERERTPGFTDLKAEMTNFRRMPMAASGLLELSDMVEFSLFDANGRVSFDNIKVQFSQNKDLRVLEDGREIALVERKQSLFPQKIDVLGTQSHFEPPIFGITTLGAGHGFDPNASTSGLIIWVNRRGIVIDPPVNTTENLQRLGVSPKLIDKVILTHCHADHDAGTLQKILQEGRINLYTTKTIFQSFVRKSVALTGITMNQILQLVSFFPVQIGKQMIIGGGTFLFNYTLHSIPTISIQASMDGKSMIYSSDTMNEPGYINSLYEQGIISKNRRDFLTDFPWHHDVIFHEAGIPPIHTPLSYLCSLPEEIQERMYLVHVSPIQIPADCNLRIALTGLQNTITLDIPPLPYDDAIKMLDAIHHVDLFESLSFERAREFLLAAKVHRLRAGAVLFQQGERGDQFYIVISGEVAILLNDEVITTYGLGGYFGEKSLFVEEYRTASAIAKTDTEVMAIQKDDMLSLIRGTESEALLRQIAIFQNVELRDRLGNNRFLRGLTATQQTMLHGLIKPEPRLYGAGDIVWDGREKHRRCYIIREGSIDIYRGNEIIGTLAGGYFLGLKTFLEPDGASTFVYIARERVSLYYIEQADLQNYLTKNPGVHVKLLHYPY